MFASNAPTLGLRSSRTVPSFFLPHFLFLRALTGDVGQLKLPQSMQELSLGITEVTGPSAEASWAFA